MTIAQKGPGPMPAISIILNPARAATVRARLVLIRGGRRSARRPATAASLVTDSMIVGQNTGGRSWPMPSSSSSSAPGIASAVRRPPDGVTSGSLSPWITSAGTRTEPSASLRDGDEDGEELVGDALG